MSNQDEQARLEGVMDVVRRLTGARVDAATPLLSSGIVDSLLMSELLEQLSQRFDVPLGVEDLGFDNGDTAEQLAALVAAAG